MEPQVRKIRKNPIRLTPAERRVILTQFLDLLARGYSKDEIVERLKLETSQFEAFLQKIYADTEGDHSAKTPLRIFTEYVIKKNALFRDLEDLKDELRGKNKDKDAKKKWYNGQAYVQACRLQSDMIDQQIKIGQELGVIEKKPDGVILIDGRDPREMDEVELETTIINELNDAASLLDNKKFKGGKILAFKSIGGKVKRQ